jgi:phosphatidylglycerol:prolipoprotein diacylglycerol transferase
MAGMAAVSNARRATAQAALTAEQANDADAVASEALSVTHWFEAAKEGEPYSVTVRFSGRRIGIRGKPTSRDTFVKEETVDGVVPGSGQVSITSWVHGLEPGEWTVTADLLRRPRIAGGRRAADRLSRIGAQSLPRAAWSWRQWALENGAYGPVKTRWAPLVRLATAPAVIPGSWSGLVAVGVLVGAVVQAQLLARAGVPVGLALLVDLLALVSGLLLAKLWYLALRPRRSWRQSIGEGWSVDGLLVAAPAVGAVALLSFDLPIGVFLDASAPALFVGVAIGRLGCFFTGCCAGRCTRSRWGVWSSDRRVGARRIPTQLLESAAGLLIAVVMTALVVGVSSAPGTVFVAAVATYVLIRQFLLRLRAEPHNAVRARVTAAAAAVVLVAATVVLLTAR